MKALGSVLLAFLGCCLLAALAFIPSAVFLIGRSAQCAMALGCAGEPLSTFGVLATAGFFAPLLIFPIGAYVSRHAVSRATTSTAAQVVVLAVFAGFPVVLLFGLNLADRLRKAYVRQNELRNPEIVRERHDQTRFLHLNTFKLHMETYHAVHPSIIIGAPHTVYISIPDSDPQCGNLQLPAIPAGKTYHCVPTEQSIKVDGTGWIPVNFRAEKGNPKSDYLAAFYHEGLPIDPENTVEDGRYYTYAVDARGAWELRAHFTSQKYTHDPNLHQPPLPRQRNEIAFIFEAAEMTLRWDPPAN